MGKAEVYTHTTRKGNSELTVPFLSLTHQNRMQYAVILFIGSEQSTKFHIRLTENKENACIFSALVWLASISGSHKVGLKLVSHSSWESETKAKQQKKSSVSIQGPKNQNPK